MCSFAAIATVDVEAAALNSVAPVRLTNSFMPCNTVKCVRVVDVGVPVATSTLGQFWSISMLVASSFT